jgi:glutamyl-tRNA synthetase
MIRTRFAPSPTGYLHIGGVRTALFNWLLARQAGGQFLLRIDDTDAERNVQEAVAPILNGFRWLGIDWDEGPEVGGPHAPYFQSQRAQSHRAAVEKLLESGHAYRDFARPEELQVLRDEAQATGGSFVYDRRFAAEDEASEKRFLGEGRSGVVRLKMPRTGDCIIDDLVRGEVRVAWENEQDHVIARADGSCLYHLASVVDDHEMQITHIVRAEEHLPNTPRQIFILESLGYTRPVYAHLPYVAEPGGTAKLSKRKLSKYLKNKDFADLLEHGNRIAAKCGFSVDADTFNPVIVDFYEAIGFSPHAILNYLLLLGWSHDGEREKFTREEMIKYFTLSRVNRSPASFDPQKLMAFQGDDFASQSIEERLLSVVPFAVQAGYLLESDAESMARLKAIVTAAGDRLKLAGDIIDYEYFFRDEFSYDEPAFEKRVVQDNDARQWLGQLGLLLKQCDDFTVTKIEQTVGAFCHSQGIKLKQIIYALRLAVTGVTTGFGMFESMEILGRDRCVRRIEHALTRSGRTVAEH